MNKLIAIMQPTYLPWMGYFSLINEVDIFVFHDDIKFDKQSWQHRNKIKSANSIRLISIPVSKKESKSNLICDIVYSDDSNWKKKHLNYIKEDYRKAKFFNDFFPFLESLYEIETRNISSFNSNIIQNICKYLDVKETRFVFSSDFSFTGIKIDKLINILKYFKANEYLSPQGSYGYIEENNKFKIENIKLYYQNFESLKYQQLYGDFVSHLSIIDAIFNLGKDTLNLINKGIKYHFSHEELKKLKYGNQ